ncbi:MAG: hypothetical protein AUK34_09200 [Ignavibacteria bacterium CG2_30_36_16]|nr:T9SS type A sorting domain-containing protein [Ignavibacteria bacterium]OIP58450.1 MAG: hypothetical protein AUK34_09200 [Ignavibacteria bacterium CG2_30_36_16]
MVLRNILLFVFLIPLFQVCPQTRRPYVPGFDSKELHKNFISVNASNIGDTDIWLFSSGGAKWDLLGTNNNIIVYDHGPWIIGKINNEVKAGLVKWISSFSPGPIINGKAALDILPQDSLKYRVYKISKNDSINNPDVIEWAAGWGAPVDVNGQPVVYADETLWTIYNGLFDHGIFGSYWEPSPSIPVEIQQKTYCYDNHYKENILSSTIFYEYTLINKSSQTIDSAYFGFWSDIDFGHPSSNFPAIDINRQLAYCWTDDINPYSLPVSVGYVFLNGPVVKEPNSSAIFDGRIIPGYKNLSLSSFHPINGHGGLNPVMGQIVNMKSAWNVARGLDTVGNCIIDSSTGTITKFPLSGDPVTGTGYVYPFRNTSGEAGFVMFSGPFTMAPMDTQWVVLALIAAKDSTGLRAITQLRHKADVLRSIPYMNLVTKNVIQLSMDITLPEYFSLKQNYPNPFNSITKIKFTIPFVGDDISIPVKLKLYDMLGEEIALLADGLYKPGEYEVEFNSNSFGNNLSSGVYFYSLEAREYFNTRKMIILK